MSCRLSAALVVSALSALFVRIEQSQAQLYLDIFPSQDNANATLWVFSGPSTARGHSNSGPHIRTSSNANCDQQDTTKTSDAFFLRNGASHQQYALTALRTATATNSPLYFESLRARLGHAIKLGTTNTYDDITIPSNATNSPTLTLSNNSSTNSRTLAHMLLRDVPNTGWDDIGPRVGGSGNFVYGSSGMTITWTGAGAMNRPISDFHVTVFTAQKRYNGNRPLNAGAVLGGYHAWQGNEGLRIRVHGAVISEPEEYALVFGLFALGFVLFHRCRMMQKKRRQAQATPTS